MRERRNDLEITNEIPQNCFCRSQTRINLLFTMSDITHAAVHPDCACELMFRGRLFEAASIFDFIWWSQTGSNRRPHACKARALPAELWPRNQKTNAYSMSVVGLGRLELPTSRLSSARSNQLSYKPLTHIPSRTRDPAHAGPARVRPRRKR